MHAERQSARFSLRRPGFQKLSLQTLSFRALSALTIIMAVGFYLRVVDVWRPVDGSVTTRSTLWRETDVASIARNFYREDNNILYPRTLWRENTPGFVESEFPLYPWLVAQAYGVFGYHEQLARLLSLLISALTLFVLTRISFFLFNETGALAATAFFAVNPLLIYLATAVQSDTLMLLFLSLALYYYLRGYQGPAAARDFLLSAGFLSLAILCKATAATYALFFALDTLRRNGWRQAFSSGATYIALALVLLPNLAWILHSHRFWLDYRMSLGVTNEGHLIGGDMLFDSRYYRGFIDNTVAFITSYPGAIALIVGLWGLRRSSLGGTLYTLGISLSVFYFVTLYTTGAFWAFYYHALSIPFAGMVLGALAQGLAFSQSHRSQISYRFSLALVLIISALAGAGIGYALHLPPGATLGLAPLTAALALALLRYRGLPDGAVSGSVSPAGIAIIILTALTLTAVGARSFRLAPQEHNFVEWSACARGYATEIPETARIACWGSSSRSSLDRTVAYNVPWMFFWMDRQGFSVPEDLQSIATLDSVALLGAEYYVEFLPGANRTPGFHDALRNRYTMLDSCGVHVLYSLK